jgi:hypothetical protein
MSVWVASAFSDSASCLDPKTAAIHGGRPSGVEVYRRYLGQAKIHLSLIVHSCECRNPGSLIAARLKTLDPCLRRDDDKSFIRPAKCRSSVNPEGGGHGLPPF